MRRLLLLISILCIAVTPVFAQTIGTAVVIAQGAFTLQPTQTLTLSAQIVGCNSTTPTYQGNPISITPNQTPAAPFTANGSQQVTFTVPGNDQVICGGQNYSLYAITWKVNGFPIAPTQTYRFTDGQTVSLSQLTSIGFVPASIANQYRSLCGAGQYLNGYDQNYNPQCYPIPTNTIVNNIIQGGTGSVVGTDVVAAGADFTGNVDASSIFSSSCSGNPNGSLFVRQGTYLLAATANLTLPTNCAVIPSNGAQFKTGNHGASNISSIQRIASYDGSFTTSLSGCTSSSTATAESFTSCPNNISNGSIVKLSGLTNVANCYQGCSVTAATGTSFTVSNPSTIVASGSETGSIITATGGMTLSLATLGCQSASTVSPGIITISSCANSFPALPIIVTLAATTNVHAGSYVVIPSSVTGTGFQLVCSTGCTNVATGAEAGTAAFISGGLTYVHFATAVAGLPAAGWLSPNGGNTNGLGQMICTGTTNYNGPYWITAVADSTDVALMDPRMTAAQETAGNCYIPYTLTIKGSVQAATNQQMVVHGSSVNMQGQGTVYVGWYGAQGNPTSANDWLAFQEALFWNPAKVIKAPKIGPATLGFGTVATPDYEIGDSLQFYGNAQELDGEVAGLWDGGTTLACNGLGPCVISRPDTATPLLSHMGLYGTFCAGNISTYTLFPTNHLGQDGWLTGSGEFRADHVFPRCLGRDGIRIESAGGAFNITVYGRGEPDYWNVHSLRADANRGYGLSCWGTDCNGGHLDGMSDFNGNTYGGIWSSGESPSTADGFGSEGNSPSVAASGTTAITGLTVTNPTAYNTTCTATFASMPATYVTGAWLIIAGTDGSGGLANTDNGTGLAAGFPTDAWQITSTGTNTATFSCPGASGGPGSTGTAKTADSYSVFNTIQNYPNGYSTGLWTIAGPYGGLWQIMNPYTEVTNGCPQLAGGGAQFGGNNEGIVTGVACNGTGPGYGKYGGPGFWSNNAGGWTEIASSHTWATLQPQNMTLNLINGIGGGVHGINFVNSTLLAFSAGGVISDTDWEIGEVSGGGFEIKDIIDNINTLAVFPAAGLNEMLISAPSATAVTWFNDNTTLLGDFNFFKVGSAPTTSIDPVDGIQTNGISQRATKDFAGTCTMAAGTVCTFTSVQTYANKPICIATEQGTSATVIAAACDESANSTTVTITGATSSSATFAALLIGNPN